MRTIYEIDRDITTNNRTAADRAEVSGHKRPVTAQQWQALRNRDSDFVARDAELYRERGIAQDERDQREYRATVAASRRPLRTKKCPTCGSRVAA